MHPHSLSIAFSRSPTLPQTQTAAEWLAEHSYPDPDLEIALHLVVQGRIIPQEAGEWVEIAVEQFAWSGLPKDLGVSRRLFAAAQAHR